MLYGTDPTNFDDVVQWVDSNLGFAASRAAISSLGRLFFKSGESIIEYVNGAPGVISQPIEPLIAPDGYDGGETISPAALSNAAMGYYDRRIHYFSPLPGGSLNAVDYVYDLRNQCWTRWILPAGITSCGTLSGTSSGQLFYMGGYDGQIYAFVQGADRTSVNGTDIAISGNAQTRAFGEEQTTYSPAQESGLPLFEPSKINQVFAVISARKGTEITLYTYGDEDQSFSQVFNIDDADVVSNLRMTVPGNKQGAQVFAGVSFQTTKQLWIKAIGVDLTKRGSQTSGQGQA
jgi:hypothetical protein